MKLTLFALVLSLAHSISAECTRNPSRIPVLRIPNPLRPNEVLIESVQTAECSPAELLDSKKALTVTDMPFNISVVCKDITDSKCTLAKTALKSAADKLATVLQIRKTINIQVGFRSFCPSVRRSCELRGVLGAAAPSSFFLGHRGDQKSSWYPQGIVKQYATSKSITYEPFDLIAEFNADQSFYFASSGSSINRDEIDFELVVMHEIIHGLGFFSTWQYYNQEVDSQIREPVFAPAMRLDERGRTQGWLGLTIFDTFLRDASTDTSLFDLGAKMTSVNIKDQSLVNALSNILRNNDAKDAATVAFKAATSISGLVFASNSRSISLYAPKRYSSGSSVSHLNTNLFNSSAEFLMCHDASSKAGISLTSAISSFPTNIGGLGPLTREILGMIGWPVVNQTGFNENAVFTVEDQFSIDVQTSDATQVFALASLLLVSLSMYL